MLTAPNTPAREKEVDEFLSGVRALLVSGQYVSVTIDRHHVQAEPKSGFVTYEFDGGFTLEALSA